MRLPGIVRVVALRVLLHHRLEGREGLARRGGRALREVHAEQALENVRSPFEIHEPLDVPRVVHARMGRVLADELVRGVDGGLALAGPVVGVDEVQPRLAGLFGEREAGGQRLVQSDGRVEVVGRAGCAGPACTAPRAPAGAGRASRFERQPADARAKARCTAAMTPPRAEPGQSHSLARPFVDCLHRVDLRWQSP